AEALKARLMNSDTLMLRLQLDPAQTSSEQLRALGFTSTPSGGSLRDALGTRVPAASAPRSTTAAESPVPGPPSRDNAPLPPPPPGTPQRWLRAALAAGSLLAIALALWFAFASPGRRPLSADERDLVAYWLERAQQRIGSGELVVAAPGSDGS